MFKKGEKLLHRYYGKCTLVREVDFEGDCVVLLDQSDTRFAERTTHESLLTKIEEETDVKKEQILQLVSEAIDKGAYVRVHVGQYDQTNEWPWEKHTKEQAEDYINRFKEALGAERIEHDSGERCDSVEVRTNKISVAFSYFPYMEEDIKFHEDGEESA